jgi:hypothetical protein
MLIAQRWCQENTGLYRLVGLAVAERQHSLEEMGRITPHQDAIRAAM